MRRPERIVCLTAETTEVAFAAGAGDRVVGVSGYAVRLPEARRKPHVAAFQTAHVQRILALEPDLVLGFSDLQADIATELIRRGVTVLITNQRTLAETALAIATIGAVLGEPERGKSLADEFERDLAAIGAGAADLPRRPRVLFEEWDEPLITGIAWVSELIELCGGEDIFPEHRGCRSANDRIVAVEAVPARDPDVIVASWCGKKVRPERIVARPGWERVAAVRNGQVHEIKAPDILQPGPSLVHGARQLAAIIRAAAAS
ncbi:MAG: cobalamin-binding protein [Hyphomicrobiales bacterium]